MRRYLAYQLVQLVIVLWGVSIAVFVMIRLTGDPVAVMLPPDATREQADELRERFGLTEPLPVQYAIWLSNAVRGDFGRAFFSGRAPALNLVVERLPATALLATLGLGLSLVISIPLGILAAVKRGSWIDTAATAFVVTGQAMPGFWFGIILIIVFAVWLKWVPVSGAGEWRNLILPTIVLGLLLSPTKMRLIRSRMAETLSADYIRTARSKGLPERQVLWGHALRNVSISIVAVVGLQFARLMEGAIVVETVFAWPGLGTLLIGAITNSDFPIVQAGVFVIAIITVLAGLLTDLAVAAIDPRVRLG
ncbi:MAG: ABC transporter permease [Dehalococcoidia bacterium]